MNYISKYENYNPVFYPVYKFGDVYHNDSHMNDFCKVDWSIINEC